MKYLIIAVSILITGGIMYLHPQTHEQFTAILVLEAATIFVVQGTVVIGLLANMYGKQPRGYNSNNNTLVIIHLLKLLYIVFALLLSPVHFGILQIVGFMVMESLLSTIVIGVSILHQRMTRV